MLWSGGAARYLEEEDKKQDRLTGEEENLPCGFVLEGSINHVGESWPGGLDPDRALNLSFPCG